jgi:putative phage-type endonuclease
MESNPFWMSFSPEEWSHFEESIFERMQEHLDASIGNMSFESFHTDFLEDLTDEFQEEWTEMGLFEEEEEEERNVILTATIRNEIFELLETYAYSFFHCRGVPPRYGPHTTIQRNESAEMLFAKMEAIRQSPQPEQRSQEWYDYRHQMITASNVWKIFGSEAECNQLIFEKCQEKRERSTSLVDETTTEHVYVNTTSPMHWGVKYEPLTIMLYESIHGVKVGAFGCITHPTYPCIGASPDGIVVEPKDHGLYGRMVEIKNIFNREITGSPSEPYWIQMQMQMETCDLDVCDFIETRFKEYANGEEEFYAEPDDKRRGIILYFLKSGFPPHYRYMPLSVPLTREDIGKWIDAEKMAAYDSDRWVLYEIQYWYLDEYSCVTVERNREWAKWAIPHICNTWDTILKERVEGYEHRASKKREAGDKKRFDALQDSSNIEVVHSSESTTQYIRNFPMTQNICLIKLDENGNICSSLSPH